MNLTRRLVKWYWCEKSKVWRLRVTIFGNIRATVWFNGTWHTWGRDGIGGENGVSLTAEQGKTEAFEACIRQGWL